MAVAGWRKDVVNNAWTVWKPASQIDQRQTEEGARRGRGVGGS